MITNFNELFDTLRSRTKKRMVAAWGVDDHTITAASLAIEYQTSVQDVDIESLQYLLLQQGATLVYMPDHSPSDSNFITLQRSVLSALRAAGK